MTRWSAVFLILLPFGCDSDGTVNNDDIVAAFTFRASLSSSGREGNGNVEAIHISGDGRRVAFTSTATDLHPDDTDAKLDLFVKDLESGELYLASRATGIAGSKGLDDVYQPRLSYDGHRVIFYTRAILDPADPPGDANLDVYLRDLDTHETLLISRAAGPSGAKGNSISWFPDISPEGRFAVFSSGAANLTADDSDFLQDVFIRDLRTNAVELVSRATGAAGVKNNGYCYSPRVSSGGTRVAFTSTATTLGAAGVLSRAYVRDRATFETFIASRGDGPGGTVSTADQKIAMSADGRAVAFSTQENVMPSDIDPDTDIYVRDIDAGITTHVSRATGVDGADAIGYCNEMDISGDGRFVSFSTPATNLALKDANNSIDVYVRDLRVARTFRASVRTFGGEVSGHAFFSALSGDGKVIAVTSTSSGLVDGDGNDVADVFVRKPLW